MKKRILIASALALGLLVIWVGFARKASARRFAPSVELGEHLVNIIGCGDCHTPFVLGPQGPEPDPARMLAGHPQELVLPAPPKLPAGGPWVFVGTGTNTAFAGPWGTTYSTNLTPDVNTGLGIWTEEMFVTALRTGRHMGVSRQIQPPMPWQHFANMTDVELRSIYAYLRTIPPITNLVPEYLPPEEPAS